MEVESRLAMNIDRLLPERLHRMRRVTGLPIAFGGITTSASTGRTLVLSRLLGTAGTGLRGVTVPSGLGLGGRVLSQATPQRVEDYASTAAITHDYDRIVLDQERLTSVIAVPVMALGAVSAVLYAAVRTDQPIGDRAMRLAAVVADQLAQDVATSLAPAPLARPDPMAAAVDDLAHIIAETTDPDLRGRLQAIHAAVCGTRSGRVEDQSTLAPREVEVLRLVEVGATNVEIAARLGLRPETVKAYLRAAMRKLGVSNRTAAVHAARAADEW